MTPGNDVKQRASVWEASETVNMLLQALQQHLGLLEAVEMQSTATPG